MYIITCVRLTDESLFIFFNITSNEITWLNEWMPGYDKDDKMSRSFEEQRTLLLVAWNFIGVFVKRSRLPPCCRRRVSSHARTIIDVFWRTCVLRKLLRFRCARIAWITRAYVYNPTISQNVNRSVFRLFNLNETEEIPWSRWAHPNNIMI